MTDFRIGYQPGRTVRNNVTSYLERHREDFPRRTALRWAPLGSAQGSGANGSAALSHEEITFEGLVDRIHHFAGGLLELGITKGDRVIIFLPMGVDMYTAMFAVQQIGAIAVFLDSWARSHHLGASAECVEPKAMISSKAAFDLVAQVPQFKKMPLRILWGSAAGFEHGFADLLRSAPSSHIEAVESESSALITFTTGSSGTPKGADRTHRFLSAQHQALNKVIPYTAEDRDLPAFPIFSLNNLAAGVTTVIPALNLAQPSETDSATLVSQILSERITCATLSPAMLVGVAKYCRETTTELPGLRRVVTGGAPISKDDVGHFVAVAPNVKLWILYGSTEVEPMAHIEGHAWLSEEPRISDPEILEEGVNVGEISEDLEYKFIRISKDPILLGPQGFGEWEVRTGEVGEFIVTGDHVCQNYFNNPDAFTKAKIRGPDGRVWHRTGDLAYLDALKHLWLVGRIHNAIARGDSYVFPVRPEVLLKRMEFVQQAAFLGLPDPKLRQKTAVVIKALPDTPAERIRAEIMRIFAKNNVPVDEIYTVESIPMDPRHHSKVEYAVLTANVLKGEGKRISP